MPHGPSELRLVLTVRDYEAAVNFYRDALELRERATFVDENGGRAILFDAGRASIEIGDEDHAEEVDRVEVGRRVAGPVRLAFEVVDAAAMTERLATAGATVIAPAVRTPWGSLNSRLDSPDGQQLTLFSEDDA